MTTEASTLKMLACLDSPDMAESRRHELNISRPRAAALGRSAVEAARLGYYRNHRASAPIGNAGSGLQ